MAPAKAKGEPGTSRLAIINAVKTPLNFFVLVVRSPWKAGSADSR